jgi:hypothetical protein
MSWVPVDLPVVRLHAAGSADAGEAWERYARPPRWPEWAPQIASVEATADRIAPGVEGLVRAPLVPVGVRFIVVDVDESSRSWRWRVSPRLGRLDEGPAIGLPGLELHHTVTGHAGGCLTTLEIRSSNWAAMPLAIAYAPLAWRALRRLVAE